MFSAVILAYFEHEHRHLMQKLEKFTMYGWTLSHAREKTMLAQTCLLSK